MTSFQGKPTRRTFNRLALAAGAAGLSPYIAAQAYAAGKKVILKAAHASSPSSTGQKAFEYMAEQLQERTDGRITMQIFPSAQLGSERETIESIQLGNLDMVFVSSAVLGAFNSQYFALDVPFMFPDRDSVYRVLDGDVGTELLQSLAKVGIKGLTYWENGFRQLTNNKKTIRTPADLSGMKMRTMENEVHIAAWKAIGANPAPLAFGELFTALQQGTFDAQEGPINLFYDMKFYEVQKFISVTNHVFSGWPLLINPDVYASFTDDDRETFDSIVSEATKLQRELAKNIDEEDATKMPQVEIVQLTPEELQLFSEKMGPINDMVRKKVGDEIMDRIAAVVAG